MTVILLDPMRPELLPLDAIKFVSGSVIVTEDVHPTTLWALADASAAPADDDGDPMTVLLSTNADHPLVRARIDRGEVAISVNRHSGDALIEAVALMDTLRRNGPWESQQTHESLRRYLLEETYELLDAIDVGTQTDLRSELGDLLLQVLFHARIAADDPTAPFDIDDVARSFVTKVSHRTPGILAGEHSDLETQIREWEERKAVEHQRGSVLDGIPTAAPALALAQKVLERLAAAGFPKGEVDPQLLSVSIDVGGRSVEDVTRQRVLDLIDHVSVAEDAARADGVELNTPELWVQYLHGYEAPEFADDSPADDYDGDVTPAVEDEAPEIIEEQVAQQVPVEDVSIDDYYGSESIEETPNIVRRDPAPE